MNMTFWLTLHALIPEIFENQTNKTTLMLKESENDFLCSGLRLVHHPSFTGNPFCVIPFTNQPTEKQDMGENTTSYI